MYSNRLLLVSGLVVSLAFSLTVSESVLAAPKVPPTVDSPTFAAVTATTATLGGTVTSDGGQALTSRGVEWGTTSGSYPNSVTEGGIAVSAFTVGVTGLPAGTTIYFRAWGTNPRGTGVSAESSFVTLPGSVVAPTVTTPTFTDVTDTTATLGGNVADDGGTTVTSRGVEWGTAPSGPYPNSDPAAAGGTGIFTVSVTDLPSSTTIYFRAWATNSGDTGYSGEDSFTTNTPAVPPTVDAPTFASVTASTAVLGGRVSADGGGAVTDRGVVWNTTSPPESGGTVESMGSGLGTFDQMIGSLPLNTLIYFKAYATNSAGVAYSTQSSFTTLIDLPTVDTPTVTSIATDSATLGGRVFSEGGGTVSVRGIVWNTTSPPESGGTVEAMGSGPGIFAQLVGSLPTGILVYYRAYATNETGTAYSAVDSFVPSGPPAVTTPTAINVTHFSADLGGWVTDDGGNPILARGTVWNTTGTPVIETDNVDVEGGTTTGVFSHTVLLPAGTTIYYRAYATSIIGTGYSAEDSFTTETEPTVQASNITFPQVAGGSMRIAWTRGNGDGCIVVLRLTATDITAPLDGDDYAANTDYTLAPELPVSSQNYVVYKGASSYLLVTGLGQSVSYSVAIYEYAGTGAGTDYLQLDPAVATRTTTDTLVHNMDYGINVCTKCHNAHGGFFYARDTELKAVCETCHIALGQAAAKLEFDNHLTPSKNPGIDYIDCGVCHELHNPGGANTTESTHSVTLETQDNKSFLRANVNKYVATSSPPAVLHTDVPKREDPHPDGPRPADTPDRAIEGGDDATARGFCQVCHTMTSYHRSSNTAGADQCHNGDTGNCGAAETHCGECHEHNNRFIGVGGTVTCVECHDAPADPLPRPITTTQFDRVSTHIPGGSAVTTEEDCLVCHDQGAHKAQAVIVWDLDDGLTSYTQPTPGASTLNTGEGELFEVHCMSCHADRNADSLPTSGSDQTQTSPFTGSDLTPTNLEIDATAWSSAGHNRPSGTFPSSPVTCVGNGTNGCHASGHGSDNLDLLAPATGPVISAADGCYVCHDADGPSSHNTRAQFETASNYQVEAGSGALVNQRHDITAADQAYSGGVVSCKDCHLVHVDNGANPVVDPDTGLPLANYSTANSYTDDGHNFPYDSGGNLDPVNPVGSVGGPYTEPDYIQFCLTCHDDDGSGNMLPPGVTMSSGMLDIASEYVSQDQHGGGDGNTGSKTSKGGLKAPYVNASDDAANNDPPSSYAAMNCSDCHGAHGTGSIFNLRESITIGGVVLTVGGGGGVNPGVLDEPHYFGSATYSLPLIDGAQKDHYWGAWCTFCHKADTHPDKDEAEACTNGHMHGGGSF